MSCLRSPLFRINRFRYGAFFLFVREFFTWTATTNVKDNVRLEAFLKGGISFLQLETFFLM